MNKPDNNVVSMDALRKRFTGWKVPMAADFTALIALATLNYRPGEGLGGGDKTEGDAGRVNPDSVKEAWCVQPRDGSLTAAPAGVALNVDTTKSGLAFTKDGQLCRFNKAGDKSLTDNTQALRVAGNAPLVVKDTVSLTLATVSALAPVDGRLSLKVDDKTVMTDSDRVRVKCESGGGLKIDPNDGTLTVDIDSILK